MAVFGLNENERKIKKERGEEKIKEKKRGFSFKFSLDQTIEHIFFL